MLEVCASVKLVIHPGKKHPRLLPLSLALGGVSGSSILLGTFCICAEAEMPSSYDEDVPLCTGFIQPPIYVWYELEHEYRHTIVRYGVWVRTKEL